MLRSFYDAVRNLKAPFRSPFSRRAVLKRFSKPLGKQQCWSLLLILRIWSALEGRLLHEMTDCAMLWVDLCETIPFWPLNDDPKYSSSIDFILRIIIRFLPRVSYSRLRKDPLVLLYCLKFIVHTYYYTIVQEILLYFASGSFLTECRFYEFSQTLSAQIFFNSSIPSVLENFLPLWDTLHHS